MPETFKGFVVPATDPRLLHLEEEPETLRKNAGVVAAMCYECANGDVTQCPDYCNDCLFDTDNPEAVAAYKKWYAQFYTEDTPDV